MRQPQRERATGGGHGEFDGRCTGVAAVAATSWDSSAGMVVQELGWDDDVDDDVRVLVEDAIDGELVEEAVEAGRRGAAVVARR